MPRKRKRSRLLVHMNGTLVGEITRTSSGAVEFRYTEEWLAHKRATPISSSLPLREETYRDPRVNAFFDNLLPDSDTIRRTLAERSKAEGKTPFDLLAAIGRDCVGSLQFVPEGETLPEAHPVSGEPLTDEEIGEILKGLKANPLGLGRDREFRISIAGTQEKTALLRFQDKWCRPLGPTPTTHIFKPAIGMLSHGIDMSQSVENEWLCLKLTEYFGLPTAQATMETFAGVRCLVVERFDRTWSTDGKQIYRLAQEDLCQALGVPSSQKYESDGGPGIPTIMRFLNASDQRDRDRDLFMRLQLVFFLLAGIDGHAKNFSIFLLPTGYQMTPTYDILSVHPALEARQLEPKNAKLAMAIGDNRHYRLREIRPRHWEQTAKLCGYPVSDLHKAVDELLKKVHALDDQGTQFSAAGEKLFEAISSGIKKNSKSLLEEF